MVTIKSINTRPELDPYHIDTSGITRTVLLLYEDGVIIVDQRMKDNFATLDEWHGRTLVWNVPHCTEASIRVFLDANLPILERIHAGHFVEWDGSNFVGCHTKDSQDACTELEYIIDDELNDEYSWGDAEDWLGDYYDKPLRILPLNTVIQMALDDSEDMVLFGVEKYLQKRAKELKDKL